MRIEGKANSPLFVLSCFRQGFKLLVSSELRRYLMIPLLVNLVLYGGAFALSYYYIEQLINEFIPAWLHWLNWILWPVIFICFSVAVYFSFTVLANILASPFYGKLAAKTAKILTGETTEVAEAPMAKAMLAELDRAGYLALRFGPSLLLFVIPGVNLLAPVIWGVLGAWGMALEFFAYPLENRGILFGGQKQLAKKTRLGSLSFGAITLLGLTLPLLNILMPPWSVIAATVYWHRLNLEDCPAQQ